MKNFYLRLACASTCITILTSCNPQTGTKTTSTDSARVVASTNPTPGVTPTTGPTPTPMPGTTPTAVPTTPSSSTPVFDDQGNQIGMSIAPTLTIKDFDQIILTYSNLTKVPTSDAAITAEIMAVKSSLPQSNEPGSLTAFHTVGAARLAFAFCNKMYTNDMTMYQGLTAAQGVDKIMKTFLATPLPAAEDAIVRNQLLSIANDVDLTPKGATQLKTNLIAACSSFLGSAYFFIN